MSSFSSAAVLLEACFESASTLDGRPLDLENEGGVISVTVRYSGGGEMIAFALSGESRYPLQKPQ